MSETNEPEIIVELEDAVVGGEVNDINLLQVEAVPQHPLEALVRSMALELSELYNEELFSGKFEDMFHVSSYLGKRLFSRRKIYVSLLEIEETSDGKEITAHVYDENSEPILRRHRERYLRENLNVTYFKIIRGPKTFVRNR